VTGAQPPNVRADFSPRARQVLACRAAYRCSNPHCSALTVGPGASVDDVSETGVAAHIYSASSGGPRGTGDLSFEQRRGVENGIWLCHRCGRLVDNNEGDAYPPALLRSWRDLHDTRNRIEHGGSARPLGWIHSIEISDGRWTAGTQQLHLSQCNFLIGGSGTGKSCFLSFLVGLSHPHELMRRVLPGSDILGEICWFDPQPRRASIAVSGGRLNYEVDGKRTPFVSRPYRCIVVNDRHYRCRGGVEEIAQALGVDPWTVLEVLPQIGDRVNGYIAEARVEDGTVMFRTTNSDRLVAWGRGISAVEANAIFFELAIAIADLQSEVEPTLLAFDSVLWQVDLDTRKHLFDLMSADNRTFQSVVLDGPSAGWPGRSWALTKFDSTETGTKLLSVTASN
jgi:hypothetical protein